MSNVGEIYFALYGDFPPEDATPFIGLSPSSTKEANPQTRKLSAWICSTGEICGEPLDLIEAASRLVDRLMPHEIGIRNAISELGLTPVFQVVLTISGDENVSTPILGFSPQVVSFLSAVGAAIDVDLYRD